jgi:hypothetical protein
LAEIAGAVGAVTRTILRQRAINGCQETASEEDGVKALAEGLYIKHSQYGCGVVTQSDTERTTIDFDAHGIKKFVTGLMVVEPAEGTPPKRSKSSRRKKPVAEATAATVTAAAAAK